MSLKIDKYRDKNGYKLLLNVDLSDRSSWLKNIIVGVRYSNRKQRKKLKHRPFGIYGKNNWTLVMLLWQFKLPLTWYMNSFFILN